jgi:hypothetical protein
MHDTAKETEVTVLGSWVIQYYSELVDTGNKVPARLHITIQV